MKIGDYFKALGSLRRASKRGYSIADLDKILMAGAPSYETLTGLTVSEYTALNLSAVYDAVWALSSPIASIPLFVYRRVSDLRKERYTNHPLYRLLHTQPNPEMTSYVWRETLMYHLLLWGNSYNEIVFDGRGNPIELWPMNPATTKPIRTNDGELIYKHRKAGVAREIEFPAWKILHIPGLGFDGRVGYSVVSLARQSIALGMAMEEFGARFFGQGATMASVLEHPGSLGTKGGTIPSLKKQLEEFYSGLVGAHKTLVLEEGMKWHDIGIPPEDAQFLASREFQVTEIARWFHVPPHKLKDLKRATFSNIEEQQLEWVTDSLRPWCVRIEQHLLWKLVSDREQDRVFIEFMMEGLLRGNTQARYQSYHTARVDGVISANEWRALENMNPIEEPHGDAYWMPLNMVDASKAVMDIESVDKFIPEEKAVKIGVGRREWRSMLSRRRLSNRQKVVYRRVVRRLVAAESEGIREALKVFDQKQGPQEFYRDLDRWYAENEGRLRSLYASAIEPHASGVFDIAADETGVEVDKDIFLADLTAYVDKSTKAHVYDSKGQVKALVRKALDEGKSPVDVIQERLEEWEERRPDKIADHEAVSVESVVSQYVYFAAGFQCRWTTIGDQCDYCNSLDGTVIGGGGVFVGAGEAIQPEGLTPMVSSENVTHPPAHVGCDCMLISTSGLFSKKSRSV